MPLAVLALVVSPAANSRPNGGTIVAFVAHPPSLLLAASGNALVGTVSVAPGPTAVAATVDGRIVLVVSPTARAVTVVDGRRRAVLAVINGFSRPVDVAIADDARYAFVADAGASRIAVVDVRRSRVVARVSTPGVPHRVAVHGLELWVTFGRGERAPEVLDVSRPVRPRALGRVHLGGAVGEIAFAADGLHAYATFRGPRLTRLWALSFRRSPTTLRRLDAAVDAIAVDVLGKVWTAHGPQLEIRSPRTLRVERTLRLQSGVRGLAVAGGFVVALTAQGVTTIDIVRARRFAATAIPGGTALAVATL